MPPSWSAPDLHAGGRDARLSVTPASDRGGHPHPARSSRPPADPTDAAGPTDLFLKQNGQVYAVRDWPTLERWIAERRVDASDLVSIGGVRWEPVGSRADLAPLLPADAWSTHSPSPSPGAPPNIPASNQASVAPAFLTESPFASSDVWSDDDADGVPVGLPPLSMPAADPTPPFHDSPSRSPASWPGAFGASSDPAPTAFAQTPASLEPRISPDPAPSRAPRSGSTPSGWASLTPSPAPAYARAEVQVDLTGGIGIAATAEPVAETFPHFANPADFEFEDHSSARPVDVATRNRSPSFSSMRDPEPAIGAEVEIIGDSPFDPEWEEELAPALQPVSGALLVGAALTLLAVAGVALYTFWPAALGPRPTASQPNPAPIAEVAPAEAHAPHPPAEPEVHAPPKPTATTTVALSPVAPAAPVDLSSSASRPAEFSRSSAARPVELPLAQLMKRGWDLADTDRAKSALLFERALKMDAGNNEAHYGLGYVRLMQGRVEEAAPHLCDARDAREEDIRVDVRGLLTNHGVRCE